MPGIKESESSRYQITDESKSKESKETQKSWIPSINDSVKIPLGSIHESTELDYNEGKSAKSENKPIAESP